MMKRYQEQQEIEISYEQLGYEKIGYKKDAPLFQKEPIDFKNIRSGEDVIVHPGNILAGTILRGALAAKAKATPLILELANYGGTGYPYQIATAYSREAANLIAAISGPSGAGVTKAIEGWWLYDEFPLRDRSQTHLSDNEPKGITIDGNGVYFAEGTNLFKMPQDFSSITQLTPSGSAIPAVNGLTSDGVYLYTVNWDSAISKTRFYQISISGSNYSWQEILQLNFRVDKVGCWTEKYFIGYDSSGSLLREWEKDGTLWRNIGFGEPNFMGAMVLNRFVYIAIQLGSTAQIKLLPLRI